LILSVRITQGRLDESSKKIIDVAELSAVCIESLVHLRIDMKCQ